MNRLRARLPHLLALWGGAAAGEVLLYYFFLSRPYFRGFFTPFAIALLVGALIATWPVLRGRHRADRRSHDRRAGARRVGE